MVQSGQWIFGIGRHDHFAGVQKFITRSDFQKITRAVRSRIRFARARDRPALQSASEKRPDRAAGRSSIASAISFGRDRLLRFEDERDFGACVAARANWHADYSDALRTTAGR